MTGYAVSQKTSPRRGLLIRPARFFVQRVPLFFANACPVAEPFRAIATKALCAPIMGAVLMGFKSPLRESNMERKRHGKQ